MTRKNKEQNNQSIITYNKEKEYVQYALCNNDTNISHKYNLLGHREQDIIYCPLPTYNIYKKELTTLGITKEIIIESFRSKEELEHYLAQNPSIKNKINKGIYTLKQEQNYPVVLIGELVGETIIDILTSKPIHKGTRKSNYLAYSNYQRITIKEVLHELKKIDEQVLLYYEEELNKIENKIIKRKIKD